MVGYLPCVILMMFIFLRSACGGIFAMRNTDDVYFSSVSLWWDICHAYYWWCLFLFGQPVVGYLPCVILMMFIFLRSACGGIFAMRNTDDVYSCSVSLWWDICHAYYWWCLFLFGQPVVGYLPCVILMMFILLRSACGGIFAMRNTDDVYSSSVSLWWDICHA